MSEDNAPKLRLKPKLAVDAVVPPPPPAGAAPVAETPPPPPPLAKPADESKAVRLKPKLSPAQSSDSFPPPQKSAAPTEIPAPEPDKQAFKFNLKPKEAAETARPVFSPPTPANLETMIGGTPIPPPAIVEPDAQTFPAELLAHKPVTAKPFPPPPGNFPPPPAASTKPAPPWAKMSSGKPADSKKKKIVVWGGFAVVLLLVLGGAFFAYQKFTAPAPVIVKKPVVAEPVAVAPVPHPAEVAPVAHTEPVKEVAPVVPVEPVVEEPPPPPPASVPFKAWVENLRVGGVRTGANTRVFIGGTAYEIGDLVNPQLGIYFHNYNVDTRKLTFRDKTGALVEKRN